MRVGCGIAPGGGAFLTGREREYRPMIKFRHKSDRIMNNQPVKTRSPYDSLRTREGRGALSDCRVEVSGSVTVSAFLPLPPFSLFLSCNLLLVDDRETFRFCGRSWGGRNFERRLKVLKFGIGRFVMVKFWRNGEHFGRGWKFWNLERRNLEILIEYYMDM